MRAGPTYTDACSRGSEDSGKYRTSTLARASRRKCKTSKLSALDLAKAMALTNNNQLEKKSLGFSSSRDNDDEVWLGEGLGIKDLEK